MNVWSKKRLLKKEQVASFEEAIGRGLPKSYKYVAIYHAADKAFLDARMADYDRINRGCRL